MMEFKDFQGPAFMLRIPTHWYVTSNQRFQAIFMSPPVDGGLKANVTVSIRPVESNVTSEEVAQSTRAVQEKEYPEYKILTEGTQTRQGNTAFERSYRWLNRETGVQILQRQMVLVADGVLYALTSTRPDLAGGEELDQAIETMFQSFQLT